MEFDPNSQNTKLVMQLSHLLWSHEEMDRKDKMLTALRNFSKKRKD